MHERERLKWDRANISVNRRVRVHMGIRGWENDGSRTLAMNMYLALNTHNSVCAFSGCTAVRGWHILSLHLSRNILQMSAWMHAHLSFKPPVIAVLVMHIEVNVKAKCCVEIARLNRIISSCFHSHGLVWVLGALIGRLWRTWVSFTKTFYNNSLYFPAYRNYLHYYSPFKEPVISFQLPLWQWQFPTLTQ